MIKARNGDELKVVLADNAQITAAVKAWLADINRACLGTVSLTNWEEVRVSAGIPVILSIAAIAFLQR